MLFWEAKGDNFYEGGRFTIVRKYGTDTWHAIDHEAADRAGGVASHDDTLQGAMKWCAARVRATEGVCHAR